MVQDVLSLQGERPFTIRFIAEAGALNYSSVIPPWKFISAFVCTIALIINM